MNVGIRKQALLLTGIPLAFLALVLILALLLQTETWRTAGWSRQSTEVLAAADGMVHAVTDANADVSAYAKSKSPSSLAAFGRDRSALASRRARLVQLVGDDPAARTAAARFSQSASTAMAILSTYAADLRSGKTSAAKALVASPKTRAVAVAWSRARIEFGEVERVQTLKRFAILRRELQISTLLLLLAATLGVVVTLAVAMRFALQMARRLELLAENARRLGSGQETLPIEGDDEIAAADRMYREMAESIERSAKQREATLAAYQREHHIASTLQHALLPQELSVVSGIRFDGVYEPGRAEALVGGDWYDAVPIADGRVVISIGDVAGSGLHAAVIMASVRQVIRGVAQVYADPMTMIDAADRTLKAQYPESIVTAFVAIFDPVALTLSYASAAHPPPLVRSPEGAVSSLPYGGLPLGLRVRSGGEGDAGLVHLANGMTVLFYTDGLIEWDRDVVEGERLLSAAFAEVIPDADSIARDLYGKLLPNGATDDVALLAMHVGEVRPADQESGGEGRNQWEFDTEDREAAQFARLMFVTTLRSSGANDEQAFMAELIFGELVSNAVRYAPGPIRVVLDWTTRGGPVLHVLDRGPGFVLMPRLPSDLMNERGRGLFLIWTAAEDFNVTVRPDGGAHARVVLPIRFSRPPAGNLSLETSVQPSR